MDVKNYLFKKYNLKYFKEELIIHPFNLILLFIISTVSVKLKAGFSLNIIEIVIAFLITFAFGIGTYFFVKLILKDRLKSYLSLTVILFFILFFRDLYELLASTEVLAAIKNILFFLTQLMIAVIALILFLTFLIIWICKTKLNFEKLNSYLNLLTTVFLVIEIINLGFTEVNRVELNDKINLERPLNEIKNKPDIYFIILDGYTNFSALQKYWDFENDELKNFLKNHGFFVAEKGRTIYNVTNYSLASTFNLTKLNFDKDKLYEKSNYLALADLINNNIIADYFCKIDYNFTNLSFYDIQDVKKYYEDIYFLKNGNIYQSRALLGSLYEMYNELISDMDEINLSIFEKVKAIQGTANENPRFIYAHIMMPHPPYYFDAEGNRNDFRIASDKKNKTAYLEQLKYTNSLLMETLENILNSGSNPPIIVVQGDHGFREFEEQEKKDVEFSVLSCYFFPDRDYSSLTDSMKTINTFRIILNKYFDHNFHLIN